MVETLEGVKEPQAKVAEPTSEKGTKPTEPKVEPTVKEPRTYTEEDFRHELDKAVGKSTATFQQQVTLTKQQMKAIEAERDSHKTASQKRDEDIKFLENKLLTVASDKFGGDEEALAGFKDTLALEIERRKFQREKEDFENEKAERDKVSYAQLLEKTATELLKKYQVPAEALEDCVTVEQMEKFAKLFPEVGEVKTPEPEKKFDSGKSSGSKSWTDDTATEKLSAGLQEERKTHNIS